MSTSLGFCRVCAGSARGVGVLVVNAYLLVRAVGGRVPLRRGEAGLGVGMMFAFGGAELCGVARGHVEYSIRTETDGRAFGRALSSTLFRQGE